MSDAVRLAPSMVAFARHGMAKPPCALHCGAPSSVQRPFFNWRSRRPTAHVFAATAVCASRKKKEEEKEASGGENEESNF